MLFATLGALMLIATIAMFAASMATSRILAAIHGTPVASRLEAAIAGNRWGGLSFDSIVFGMHPFNQSLWHELLRSTDLPTSVARDVARLRIARWVAIAVILLAMAAMLLVPGDFRFKVRL